METRSEGGALESYSAPVLTVYGTLEEITQLKPVGEADNLGGIGIGSGGF